MAALLGALALAAIVSPGCGGDSTSSSSTAGSAGAAGTAGSAGTAGAAGTAGSAGTAGAAGTGGTGGSTGGTGGSAPTDVGHPGGELVNAGGVAKSASYKMVFTLGQPTQNQGRTTSANYRMQGGLIGATGSFK